MASSLNVSQQLFYNQLGAPLNGVYGVVRDSEEQAAQDNIYEAIQKQLNMADYYKGNTYFNQKAESVMGLTNYENELKK